MDTVVPTLLAAPECAEERDFLHNLFTDSGWQIHLAQTFEEVLSAVREKRVGVLLSDPLFSDGHGWKDLLDEIQRLEFPPMLVVTDRLANERLWAEVLNLGGYDLLMKPFDPEEVLRVTSSAWTAWKHSRVTVRPEAAYPHTYLHEPGKTSNERGNHDNSQSGATGSTVDQHDPLPVG
jgi:DNA-binding response OmpR family regulator